MKFTYYGHSCFSVEIQGKHILFDPFITKNPLAKAIHADQIPADYIFVSHAHFDHIDDLINIALRTGAMVIANWEIVSWCGKEGLNHTQLLNPGGQWKFEFGKVKCVVAIHPSSFPDGQYGGIAGGFIFDTPEGNFYYSGDTALTLDMQLVPKWAKLDFAVLPIGDDVTMGVTDAIEVAKTVNVKTVVGAHYDTFEFIKIDHKVAMAEFSKNDVTLKLLPIGFTDNL
jgi:L-ascorbate metabolism protein UlaG (beta-lactamase superfamily)